MVLIPEREGQELDRKAISEYLQQHIPSFPANEKLEVKQFSAGVANLTYLIKCGDWEAVLRRPPNGPLPPKAHDMNREYNFLTKIHPHYPLVPETYAFTDDKSIIGVPFFVMEYKKGAVLDYEFPNNVEITDSLLETISENSVNALAELHQIDYEEAGLADLGYPKGFLERQVKGWINRYEKSKVEEIPYYEEVSNWLLRKIPESDRASIIHNDFKLNNMLFSDDLQEITAILDWEMVTVGDPLFDLATALGYWIQHDDSELLTSSLSSLTATKGFITREEFIHRYSLKTGTDVANMKFYMTLIYFRTSVVVQQMYYRYKIGQTTDPRYKNMLPRIRNLMAFAYETMISRNYDS